VPRTQTTCVLQAYLDTNQAKPEEGAVAVLAAVMRANREFAMRMIRLAGGVEVGEAEQLIVGTEEPTFVGLQHVDLEIRAFHAERRHVQRIWIEAKLTAPLARGEQHQLVRYHTALADVDHRQKHQLVRKVAVLLRRRSDLRRADLDAVAATEATVMLWQQVADVALILGAEQSADTAWRSTARDPDAPLSLANLDSLLWYLERKDFRVHTDPPLATDSVHHYEHAVEVGRAVAGLARLAAEDLADSGWQTTLDRPASGEPLTFASKPIMVSSPVPWWQRRGAAHADLWFQITPYDPRDQRAQACVWAGLGFTKPLAADEGWIANVRAAGFEPEEEDTGSGLIEWLGSFERLDAFVEGNLTAGLQASALTDWIRDRVGELRAFGPPPRRQRGRPETPPQ
jgi:hypothetical protein